MKMKRQVRYFLGGNYKNTYLTPREAQCVAGLLKGYSNEDIAKRLKISSSTVSFYISNVKIKLSCSSKNDLESYLYGTKFLSFVNAIYSDRNLDETIFLNEAA